MHVREEGQEGLGMMFRFLTGTVGSMVSPALRQAPWTRTSLLGVGGDYEVSFEYVVFECLWGI